jgi:hypothetical protein
MLDEAWLYFSTQHDQIWLPEDENTATNARPMISSPRTILPVVWNPHGSTWSKFYPGDASGQANTILTTFFPKSALFTLQEIEER